MKKKMLLHSCCAPCTSGVAWQLTDYDITLLFYNPNLDSEEEYNRRLDALKKLVEYLNRDYDYDLKLIAIPYDHSQFLNKIKGRENDQEGGERCKICIGERLEFTAKYASENNYDIWASTLSVSPHKNHEMINAWGQTFQDKYDVEYLPSNFKKNNGYLRSIELSKKYGIYRQRYCGCTPPKDNVQ